MTSAYPRRSVLLGAAGLIIAIVVAVTVWQFLADDLAETRQRLELTRTSLAATESFELARADAGWTRLHEELPDDASTTLNWALNRVLQVDSLAATVGDASAGRAEQTAARAALPGAIGAAREAIARYDSLVGAGAMTLWLSSRVDLREASLLPRSLAKSKRAASLDRLVGAIGDGSPQPDLDLLGGAMLAAIEPLEDPITGLPPDVLATAATAAAAVATAYPDNLYLVTRAASLLIQDRDPAAAALIRQSRALTSAIDPALRRELQSIGTTPDDLIDQISAAIADNDFDRAAGRSAIWLNVIRGTEIFKSDRRRVTPHPLDRLSFEAISRLSAVVAHQSPIRSPAGPITLNWQMIDPSPTVLVQTIDHDLDLDVDLVSVDVDQTLRLHRNDGGRWTVTATRQLDWMPTGLITADLYVVDSSDPGRVRRSGGDSPAGRHDTVPQLVTYGDQGVVLMSVADDSWQVTPDTGLEDVRGVTAAVAGDLEADGDLDLVFATADGVRMFVNRGNQTFFELPKLSIGADDAISTMAIADLDRDLDLDIITAHRDSGRVGLIENLLHLQFRGRYVDDIPAVAGANELAIEDLDGNVSWDIIVGGRDNVLAAYTQTAAAGRWSVQRTEASAQITAPMVVADLDNDSRMEIFAASGIAKLTADGGIGFQPVGASRQAGSLSHNNPRQAGSLSHVAADLDGDGGVDIITATPAGLRVGINTTAGRGHHLALRFKGIDDNATGRVNHYAIGSVLEVRFGPHYRSRIVTRPQTHFGIDGFDAAASVRTIFPNGLTQTVRSPPVDTVVEEEQTLKGSCPYLYGWDGEKYVFITDCLWAAPLGLQVARNVVAPDRPWEYLKIYGSGLKPRDGFYDFRITEELWEVAYFDQVELTAVDHPADVQVWTNEKVGPPSIAEPKIFAFAAGDRHPIVSASDTAGRDVTADIRSIDGKFVQGFDRRLRQGLCPPHWVDLKFRSTEQSEQSHSGSPSPLLGERGLGGEGMSPPPRSGVQLTPNTSPPNPIVPRRGRGQNDRSDPSRTIAKDKPNQYYLKLTGWILPTDTSLNIQIDQNPDLPPIEWPSVWVPDADSADRWRRAIEVMGFPGGKTKTMIVDVTDVIDPAEPIFRIRTSAQIYWDAAELVVQDEDAEHQVYPTELQFAEVAFHGFSDRTVIDSKQPERFNYQRTSDSAKWPPLAGALSPWGRCENTLRSDDDQMVVIGGGDEIRLRFSVPKPPPTGWVRDFVLHNVGWDKDADLNTLAGQTIGPLPSRSMGRYPPAVAMRVQDTGIDAFHAGGLTRTQSYRSFWYRGGLPRGMRFNTTQNQID